MKIYFTYIMRGLEGNCSCRRCKSVAVQQGIQKSFRINSGERLYSCIRNFCVI